MTMQVVNRKGEREDVRFDAIHDKIKTLTYGLDPTWIDPGHVTKLTIEGLYDGGTTRGWFFGDIVMWKYECLERQSFEILEKSS